MNNIKIAFVILLSITFFSACEKDDICVEPGTPLLVIEFFDIDNVEELKAVPNLRVIGIGVDAPFASDTFSDRSSVETISIPLRPDATTTSFSFIINSANDEDGMEIGNADLITFNYDNNEVFISRACGFVVNYDNLTSDFTTPAPENWIQNIEIITTLVENSDATHVQIFH